MIVSNNQHSPLSDNKLYRENPSGYSMKRRKRNHLFRRLCFEKRGRAVTVTLTVKFLSPPLRGKQHAAFWMTSRYPGMLFDCYVLRFHQITVSKQNLSFFGIFSRALTIATVSHDPISSSAIGFGGLFGARTTTPWTTNAIIQIAKKAANTAYLSVVLDLM
jgi:hypothetical protein